MEEEYIEQDNIKVKTVRMGLCLAIISLFLIIFVFATEILTGIEKTFAVILLSVFLIFSVLLEKGFFERFGLTFENNQEFS